MTEMKIPAIRAQIGMWVYYISTLTFTQVNERVKKVDDELHKSKTLRDRLQRSITDNYKRIASYITNQDERFFNSLVLAVYDGDPQWDAVRLEYDDGSEFHDLGILTFTGNEKIFPVDGQHRTEGIRAATKTNPDLQSEKIPVIFIGHRKDSEGMQRARRMFSTLNRYAKPVSLGDVIALDEDDIVAIACRELLEDCPFFAGDRILVSKNKAISVRDNQFTTIITLYECNMELLRLYLSDKTVYDPESGKEIVSKNKKIETYLRFRPCDKDIFEFAEMCSDFWIDMSEFFVDLKEYKNQESPDSSKFRNRQGGSLFFRPTALLALVKTFVFLKSKWDCSFNEAFQAVNKFPLILDSDMWKYILWNPIKGTMITTNSVIVKSLLLYCIDKSLLDKKEIETLINSLQDARQTDREIIENEFLEQFATKEGGT
jgi:DNA sulfur modification protein DndB